MKNIHNKNVIEISKENRFIYYFGEDQQKAEIGQKLDEKKAEAEKKNAEAEENKPEKVLKLKSRYSSERTDELVKCHLIATAEPGKFDPFEQQKAGEKQKAIKEKTIEPEKLEGNFLTGKEVNDNMRKLYAILGKDWDQIKADEAQKEKEAKEKAAKPEEKPKEGEAKPEAPSDSPDKPKTIKFDSVQRLITESIDKNPDAKTKEAADAVTTEIEAKTKGKEFKTIDEVKTAIQIAVNNMDGKYLSALAGKIMKFKAGEYNISFRFVQPNESPVQKAGIESVTFEKEAKPKPPEKPEPPKEQEALKRIKFSSLQRLSSNADKNADANTKEALDAVMKAMMFKTQGIEFQTSDELIKEVKNAMNGLDKKYLAVLAGKDISIKAGEYNIAFRFIKPGESTVRPLGVESVFIEKNKPVEVPKPPEAKDKPSEDKSKPVESKEVTELRGKISAEMKSLFEEFSKMSKEDLIKNHYDNSDKFAYELGRRINNIAIAMSPDLSKLGDECYSIDSVYPNTNAIKFNKNGVFIGTMGKYIDNLFKEKNITDIAKKETPNAYEYITQFHNKTHEVTKRFEDKAYITQLGITTYEDYLKKFEAEVNVAVGTIDKKYTQKIEWAKLDGNALSSPVFKLIHFSLEKDKAPNVMINEAGVRSQWEKVKPQKPVEEKPKEEKPKAPVEEKPDPAKFNKIRPAADAAINRGLALSYEGVMYNDPIGIATAVKLQLQKLPLQEQNLLPINYMTPQGIRLQRIYSGGKMQVAVTGVTETVARKYIEKWEKEPRATAEVNEKKWAKIGCVDVYGVDKPKPEGWLKTKEGARLEKEAKEQKAKEKEKGEGKPKESDAQKPEEKPADAESPEVKEARNKVEVGMKKIFDNVSKMSKEEMSTKGVFNILHEMSLASKVLEKDLAPDLAKLDKTYISDKLQPPITIFFNKKGITMERPGQWVNDQFKAKGAVDSVDSKSPNAFNYTKLFTSKMVELRDKYSSKKALTEQGITTPEDMGKKFNQELQAAMEKDGAKLTDKIEWANLPGATLVYPNYSYASFRLEKGKKIAVSVNDAGIQDIWDKANAPKPAFEATNDEKVKEDAPDKINNAKNKVDQEVKALLKKYQDMPTSEINSKGFNNKLKLTDAIMTDLKTIDTKLQPDLNALERSYSTTTIKDLEVMFNKYGIRPIGLDNWMNNFYKDKKVKNIESEKGQTPNAKNAIDTIMKKMKETTDKCNDTEYLKTAKVRTFGEYYKLITDEVTKVVKGIDPKLYDQVEWDKLSDNTLRTPYTFCAEVSRTKDAKEPTLKFNYANLKATYDSWHYDNGKESNYVILDNKPAEVKPGAPPAKPA